MSVDNDKLPGSVFFWNDWNAMARTQAKTVRLRSCEKILEEVLKELPIKVLAVEDGRLIASVPSVAMGGCERAVTSSRRSPD